MTWALIGMYIVLPEVAVTTFGELSGSHPIFFLATWSPAIAAFVVVYFYSGGPGIRAFLSLVIPLVFVVDSLVKGGPVLARCPTLGYGDSRRVGCDYSVVEQVDHAQAG
ncbi:MAG: hypothetical protein VXW22_01900 [Pseudomonadota bacterium]|nr:hypothetical protein [Pseudomonadota bacterium]